ncbi:MAG: hypothetical protein ACLGJB_25280 [Blastocatellia bacterium]
MRFNPLAVVIVLALLPGSSPAALNESEQIRKSDLSRYSFAVGDLKITIKRLHFGSILVPAHIEISAENMSDVAAIFNPHHLSLVDSEGWRVKLLERRYLDPLCRKPDYWDIPMFTLAWPRKLGPHARLTERYELNGSAELPATLFYEGKELAVVVK